MVVQVVFLLWILYYSSLFFDSVSNETLSSCTIRAISAASPATCTFHYYGYSSSISGTRDRVFRSILLGLVVEGFTIRPGRNITVAKMADNANHAQCTGSMYNVPLSESDDQQTVGGYKYQKRLHASSESNKAYNLTHSIVYSYL